MMILLHALTQIALLSPHSGQSEASTRNIFLIQGRIRAATEAGILVRGTTEIAESTSDSVSDEAFQSPNKIVEQTRFVIEIKGETWFSSISRGMRNGRVDQTAPQLFSLPSVRSYDGKCVTVLNGEAGAAGVISRSQAVAYLGPGNLFSDDYFNLAGIHLGNNVRDLGRRPESNWFKDVGSCLAADAQPHTGKRDTVRFRFLNGERATDVDLNPALACAIAETQVRSGGEGERYSLCEDFTRVGPLWLPRTIRSVWREQSRETSGCLNHPVIMMETILVEEFRWDLDAIGKVVLPEGTSVLRVHQPRSGEPAARQDAYVVSKGPEALLRSFLEHKSQNRGQVQSRFVTAWVSIVACGSVFGFALLWHLGRKRR
jgi:hypothetical protein